jgi:hypothetical protein
MTRPNIITTDKRGHREIARFENGKITVKAKYFAEAKQALIDWFNCRYFIII